MKEMTGNILEIMADAVCVTTNGNIRNDGRAVMGAGVAKLFRDTFPDLDLHLAESLRRKGHVCIPFSFLEVSDIKDIAIVSFPTKYNWREPSDLTLIETSLKKLVQLADAFWWKTVTLTRPGCANGGLDWETQVKPLCMKYLDDRFIIVNLD